MDDRPGDPDATAVRKMLEWLATPPYRPEAPGALAAFNRIDARLSEAEQALQREAELRIRDCEQWNEYKRLLWEEEQAHDRTNARAEEAERRLSEAEAALPDTFYAHLLLPDRVRNMVAGWQKAIEVVNELEDRLSVALEEDG